MNAAEGRRIALVEDDGAQLDLLQHIVRFLGASCVPFPSGEKLLKVLERESFDLLVVDWNLPGIQGPEIVARVRELLGPAFPIVFVTSRALESDIVAGLRAGADDYVTKPVRPLELGVRIQALLRRAYPPPRSERISFGPFVFDLAQRKAEVQGKAVELQPREFDLAVFLFTNSGRLLSRAHLMQSVMHASPDVASRTLDTHVSRLRAKLGILPENGFRLSSVYGVGYRLDEVTE
ncbi:MAG TPA: response regulator transcription factor [Ramlibacter sp.]|uniref:response regulator transcription factor n=1 Tax=Ramlibacter sp. TaxID=1917967 RepID=UPI002C7E8F33|nr:response regulator transcription factor [Ramlibacter sp.]HVZ43997.1 response regulator transcription factor [Ramlibacter sp.]